MERDRNRLPPWGVQELPAPPPLSFRNLFRIVGPGAILLVSAIGSGEWLLGPAAALQLGAGVLLVVTISIFFQVVFNLESVRYTLYTGEPILIGFMRTWPGPLVWSLIYLAFGLLQLAWPGLAAACAATLFSAQHGRLPTPEDAGVIQGLSYVVLLSVVAVLLFGRRIERTLECVSWFMLGWIYLFLILINVFFVPSSVWVTTATGFIGLGDFPATVDWKLVAALAAYAGSGGIVNLALSNWMRDKGFGMGAQVGAIPGAVGGRAVPLSPTGKIFPISPPALQAWRGWWRYVYADQVALWGGGALVGMFLTVNMARGIIPAGQDLSGLGAGAYQAHFLAGQVWTGLWFFTLLNGFWILFSSQLANTEGMVRIGTDVLWSGSERLRSWMGNSVRRLYYSILLVFTAGGCIALQLTTPFKLILIAANVAGFILAFAAVHILVVNRRFLPDELRAPIWRELVLVLCAVFFGVLTLYSLHSALTAAG